MMRPSRRREPPQASRSRTRCARQARRRRAVDPAGRRRGRGRQGADLRPAQVARGEPHRHRRRQPGQVLRLSLHPEELDRSGKLPAARAAPRRRPRRLHDLLHAHRPRADGPGLHRGGARVPRLHRLRQGRSTRPSTTAASRSTTPSPPATGRSRTTPGSTTAASASSAGATAG